MATGDTPIALAVMDMDKKSGPDLVVLFAGTSSYSASVLVNQGGGSFSADFSIPYSNRPLSLVTGDYTGDGFDDVAVVASLPTMPRRC